MPKPILSMQSTEKLPEARRISALDFTKGALVLIMVLYHWINYFLGPQWEYYRYLRFLTPSFIFITGFMISNVYLAKYDAADPRLATRLFVRGIKLLTIFVVLNAARIFLLPLLSTGSLLGNPLNLNNLVAVFVTGNATAANGKVVAFSILVPISYLLLLTGFLLPLYRYCRYTFHILCGFLLMCILATDLGGARISNLELPTIGLLGLLVGFIPIPRINKYVQHPYLLAAAYAGYTLAIYMWNVPFLLVALGVVLSVSVLYLAGNFEREPGRIRGHVVRLGKYSLFGYIGQIAILQILSAGFRHVSPGPVPLCFSFLAAFALTMISVEVLDRARLRARRVDTLYKAVFA